MRSLPEWIGATDDTLVPPRVRLRVFIRDKGICQCCGRRLDHGDKQICDHKIAICNGGQNIETNLQTICDWCDKKTKTPADVAEKARTYRVRSRHLGLVPKPRGSWGYGRGDPYRKKLTGEIVPR